MNLRDEFIIGAVILIVGIILIPLSFFIPLNFVFLVVILAYSGANALLGLLGFNYVFATVKRDRRYRTGYKGNITEVPKDVRQKGLRWLLGGLIGTILGLISLVIALMVFYETLNR